MQPFVSIIIPCRNEERFIEKCLKTILEQDYLHLRSSSSKDFGRTQQGFGGQAKEKLEVLVVDGMSIDRTREIVKKFQASSFKYVYWIIRR